MSPVTRNPDGFMRHRIILASLMLLPLQACGQARGAPQGRPKGVTVSNGWFATAPNTPVVGFFSIRNTSTEAQLVTGWRSTGCHAMHLEEAAGGGGAGSGLTIPGESRMTFVRGSYQLSCDGPGPAIRAGATVPVTFSFRDGGTLTAPFAVRDVSAHPPGPPAPGRTEGG